MPNPDAQTVLFLFGSQPAESAVLEAQVLLRHLPEAGWSVRLAALTGEAAERLGRRLGEPVEPVRAGPWWLGPLRRRVQPTGAVALVHAWDLGAAAAARSVAPTRPVVCTVVAEGQIGSAVRAADRVIWRGAVVAGEPSQAGRLSDRQTTLPVAVEASLAAQAAGRRKSIRQGLGLAGEDPVVLVPPPVVRGAGAFEVAWAVLIARKAGIRAGLLLPHSGREHRRMVRFSQACRETGIITAAPADTPWLDLLAASDVLVVPTAEVHIPILVGYAVAAGVPVVRPADLAAEHPLTAGAACQVVPDAKPLSLARGIHAAWQGRMQSPAVGTTGTAALSDPQMAADGLAELYAQLDKAYPRRFS